VWGRRLLAWQWSSNFDVCTSIKIILPKLHSNTFTFLYLIHSDVSTSTFYERLESTVPGVTYYADGVTSQDARLSMVRNTHQRRKHGAGGSKQGWSIACIVVFVFVQQLRGNDRRTAARAVPASVAGCGIGIAYHIMTLSYHDHAPMCQGACHDSVILWPCIHVSGLMSWLFHILWLSHIMTMNLCVRNLCANMNLFVST